MKAASSSIVRNAARLVAAVLSYFFLFNQFAHAATLPHALAVAVLKAEAKDAATTQQSSSSATAQVPGSSPEAVVRDRLQAARKIYVVDAGADDHFPLSPSAGYNQFVATLQAWGRYTLVDTAEQADLVLQFRNVVFTQVQDGTHQNPSATVYYEPEFRLTIADPQTLKPMWSYVLPAITGTNKKTHQDYFTLSVQNMTSQLKVLSGETLSPAEAAALNTPASRIGHGKTALAIGFLGVAIALPAILFVVAKNHAEDNQHQFCEQNHLPC